MAEGDVAHDAVPYGADGETQPGGVDPLEHHVLARHRHLVGRFLGAVLRVLRARRAAEGVLHRDRVVLGPDHGVVYPHVPAAREVETVRVEGAQVDLGSGLGCWGQG